MTYMINNNILLLCHLCRFVCLSQKATANNNNKQVCLYLRNAFNSEEEKTLLDKTTKGNQALPYHMSLQKQNNLKEPTVVIVLWRHLLANSKHYRNTPNTATST